MHKEGHPAPADRAGGFRAVARQECADRVHLRHRRGAAYVLLALRHARFLYPALNAGPGNGQRALSRRDRRAEPEADPFFRGPPLGGGAAPPAGGRRTPITTRPQRRGDTTAHPGARPGIIEGVRITTRAVDETEP